MAGRLENLAGQLGDLRHKYFGPRQGPRVLVASIPKSGTHLIISALRNVQGLRVCPKLVLGNVKTHKVIRRIRGLGRSQVLVGHIVYNPEIGAVIAQEQLRLVVMMRDPRGVVASLAPYILHDFVGHRMYDYFTKTLKTSDERIMACIRGVPAQFSSDGRELPDIATVFRTYLDWHAKQGALVCRFEDMVGSQGGGSDQTQFESLARLSDFLELNLSRDELAAVAEKTFSRASLTFRKGEIDGWRQHFTPEHVAAFKEIAGPLLVELNYEKDLAW